MNQRNLMKHRLLPVVLTASVLLFLAGNSSATENNKDALQPAANKAVTDTESAKSKTGATQKHTARTKLVDINSATKKELKKLPGISDAEADKIIASRPFGSKAWLVTKNIIPKETYQTIQERIVCKLTQKEIDQIMAQAKHENKQ